MEDELNIELDKEDLHIILKEQNSIDAEIENSDIVPTGTTTDYEKLNNKPKIEGVELVDNRSFEDLGMKSLTNSELENLLK